METDTDTQPRVEHIGGVTIRYTKRGRPTARSLRAWDQARKQMGALEAAGCIADSPLYSMEDQWGIDPSEMTIDLANFDDTVPADDPDKELCELVYLRLLAFNDALAYFVGRLQKRRDTERLEALAAAITQTSDYLGSLAVGDFVDDIEEEEEPAEAKTIH